MARLARVAGSEEQTGGTAELLRSADRSAEGRGKALARAPLWQQFRPGQLLELSGARPGKLSTTARLVAHAQAEGEPVAWVAPRSAASFYPPDFAALGIDLAALVMVRIPAETGAAHATHGLVRASEVLLRSGAFGLVVIDFASAPIPRGELAWQARLAGLVRMHEARLVLLTSSARTQPSLGPLIALRVEPEVSRERERVVLKQHVIKSKLGASAAALTDVHRALSPEVRSAPAISPDVRSAPVGAG